MTRRTATVLLGTSLVLLTACAQKDWIDRTLVTENVTGAWAGSSGEGSSYRWIQLELRQQGATVTGVMMVTPTGGGGSGSFGSGIPIEGRVAGDVLTVKDERGTWSGELTIGGDDMTGKILGPFGARPISLRRTSTR